MADGDPDVSSCLDWDLKDNKNNKVILKVGMLGVQTTTCLRDHGEACPKLMDCGGQRLGPGIWAFPAAELPTFTFTHASILLHSLVRLETKFGGLLALPENEYQMWRSTGLCEVAPLVITMDGVLWRVMTSEQGVVEPDDEPYKIPDHLPAVMQFYLKAFQDGGKLKCQVEEAITRGNENLRIHREYIYKVFHIMELPVSRSHDLTKTPLINMALGRCFHGDGLDLVTDGITFNECMTLVKLLHLTVENHHPESRSVQTVSVLDMYVDRVSSGVEKSVGWSNEAWTIDPQYIPDEYRYEFAELARTYSL